MAEFNWIANRELITSVWVSGRERMMLRRPEIFNYPKKYITDKAFQYAKNIILYKNEQIR